jgi:hypothetical protein
MRLKINPSRRVKTKKPSTKKKMHFGENLLWRKQRLFWRICKSKKDGLEKRVCSPPAEPITGEQLMKMRLNGEVDLPLHIC